MMTKGYAREKMREITADRSALRKCRNVVSAGVLSPISSAVGRQLTPQIFDLAGGSYAQLMGPSETKKALAPGREIIPVGDTFPRPGARNSPLRRLRAGDEKRTGGAGLLCFFGCTAYWDLFCSFWSMAVNSGGRGQWSSTGSPVRGWTKRRPAAWRHWPVRPGTGFLAP